ARASVQLRRLRRRALHPADFLQPVLQAELVERTQRERGEHADAVMQQPIGVIEGKRDLCRGACSRSRIRNAPMSGHGLTGPYGPRLSGRIVANGENEIERRRAGPGELAPGFGAQTRGVVAEALQQPDGFRMDLPFRLASSAPGMEVSRAALVEDGLGHGRT